MLTTDLQCNVYADLIRPMNKNHQGVVVAPETKTSRLETLRQQQAKIQARIAELESRAKAQHRKDDTRLKIIVGAACLADAALHDETSASLRRILQKAVTAPRDREFLKSKGWL
jgi:hypothetical protein